MEQHRARWLSQSQQSNAQINLWTITCLSAVARSCVRWLGAGVAVGKLLVMPNARTCNCRQTCDCPLKGKCLERCLVYSACVKCPGSNAMYYYGLCETDFKTRYYKHTFWNEEKVCATELSKHIWKCKRNNLNFTID